MLSHFKRGKYFPNCCFNANSTFSKSKLVLSHSAWKWKPSIPSGNSSKSLASTPNRDPGQQGL